MEYKCNGIKISSSQADPNKINYKLFKVCFVFEELLLKSKEQTLSMRNLKLVLKLLSSETVRKTVGPHFVFLLEVAGRNMLPTSNTSLM